MSDCVFCKIASGKMGTEFVLESDDFVAFHDIKPHAPVHVLVVPKEHLATTNEFASPERAALAGRMLTFAAELAARLGLAESGYRLVLNCGPNGGQEVHHVHLHILGGRRLGWPPG